MSEPVSRRVVRWVARLFQRSVWVLTAVTATAGLARCGSSTQPSDRAAVVKAERAYLKASASGNGTLACAQLTGAARARIARNGAAATNGRTCTQTIKAVSRRLASAQRQSIRNAKITAVEIHRNHATIHVTGEPDTSATKVDGRWLLN